MPKKLIQFFLQPKCVICGETAAISLHWCKNCVRQLYRSRSQSEYAFIEYDNAAAVSLLSEMRSEYHQHAIRFLGKLLPSMQAEKQYDFVLTAPQNRDHGGLSTMARKLATLHGARYVSKFFTKQLKHRQHGKSAVDRLDAPLFVTCLQGAAKVEGARVLLLDDVSTTGTTLAQCMALLRERNVLSIEHVVLARSPTKFKGERQEPNKKSKEF